MSNTVFEVRRRFHAGIEELGHNWGWYLAFGIMLVVLGLLATSYALLASVASVIVLGWVLVFAGGTLVLLSFASGRWSGFLISLSAGILSAITGVVLLRAPLSGVAALTLVIATYLMVTGVFRAVSSAVMLFPNWGWSLLSGLVTVALGGALVAAWPAVSAWFLGIYVGIDLMVHGFAWCMFAMSIHNLERQLERRLDRGRNDRMAA